MRAINNSIDPIAAIAAVEAPIATQINQVTNAAGIPTIANQVVDSTVFPASAWTFDNVFAPKDGAQLGPFSQIARQFLDRLTPKHDADESAISARVATLSTGDQKPADAVDKDAKSDTDGQDTPKPRQATQRDAEETVDHRQTQTPPSRPQEAERQQPEKQAAGTTSTTDTTDTTSTSDSTDNDSAKQGSGS